MEERVRQITSRNGGGGIVQVVAMLRSYLVGWKEYFRLADTPRVFEDVDQWLRRRSRMVMLKQWKRGTTVYRELNCRGVGGHALGMAARFARSWWHLANHKALNVAFPGRYFESLGVPRLCVR